MNAHQIFLNEGKIQFSKYAMILLAIFFFLMFFSPPMHGQIQDTALRQSIVKASIDEYHTAKIGRRIFLNLKDKNTIQKLNPLLYVSGGLLWFYQSVFSEQIQADCTYVISCSRYTKKCIEHNGFVKGVLLGIDQLSACHPTVLQETPQYKMTSSEKVDNRYEE